MWICLNDGFVSAVEAKKGSDQLKVRARKREHLVSLFGKRKKIHESKGTDYRFRTFTTKKAFGKLIKRRINKINYDNFKDSVADNALHDLYADFWTLHWRYQHGWTPSQLGRLH